MADWRQIQARIRKAKNSPDASSKLSELYQRTRDAMVAWELGAIEEKAGRNEEAGRWYIISAKRFRRADWKKKAQEALERLGIDLPAPGEEPPPPPAQERSHDEVRAETESGDPIQVIGEISDFSADVNGNVANGSIAQTETAGLTSTQDGKKKRRRGRRGGRGRHRKGGAVSPGLPSKTFADSGASSESRQHSSRIDARSETRVETHFDPRLERAEFHGEETPSESNSIETQRAAVPISSVRRSSAEHAAPMLPLERTARGRAGDPALASRLSRLESMLRRLVSSPLHNLDQAEEAPAGPGVFLLSDSDQITSYYVEACQTLRVGIGNLVRGSRGGGKGPRGSGRGYPDTSGLKTKLAEHLEINEAKVSQYLKEHCVIRWIQLDDDAPLLAHFAIAVLRTPLNID